MPPTTKERFLPPLWILTVVGAVLILWLLLQLKEIVVLLVVGYCIAFIMNPVLEILEKKKVRRSIGIFAVFAGVALTILVLILTAFPTLGREYEKLESNLPSYVEIAKQKLGPLLQRVEQYVPSLVGTPGEGGTLADNIPSISGVEVRGVLGGIFTALLGGYNLVLMLLNLTLLPFIVFYLALDFDRIHRGALLIFPRHIRPKVSSIASEINTYVAAFVRGQLLVGTILFILYTLGLRIIGVELWFLLGIISGFGNLIPYFGFLLGITLSSIMALVTFGDVSHLVQVLVLYGVVQALEGMFITPKVVGDKVGLSPLAVILAIFAGGKLFGLLGIFLAVPGAAALRVLGRYTHRWLLDRAQA